MDPAALPNVPIGHGLHVDEPLLIADPNVPSGQSAQATAPADSLYVLSGHGRHSDALRMPSELLYVPSGQGRHSRLEFADCLGPNVPAGHDTHCAALLTITPYVPAGQGPQLAALSEPGDGDLKPIAHGRGDVAPVVSTNVPAGAAAHSIAPDTSENAPRGHWRHDWLDPGADAKVPGGHGRQLAGVAEPAA